MILVNEMFGNPSESICLSGICIKKAYPYIKYVKDDSGPICLDNLVQDIAYIKNGLYVELYSNPNPLYYVNTGDTSLCLVISESITDWVENYINSIATTGYTGNLPLEIENRPIYDSTIGTFFKLSHIQNSLACTGDTEPILAIYDNITDNIWISGGTNNYWFNEDGFNKVDSLDINPNSPTFDHITTVFKCINCNLSIEFTSTNPDNFENNDGTATVTVSGGLAPYNYTWSNGQITSGSSSNANTATGLSGSTEYSVSVTDGNGCTITGNITVGQSTFTFDADYMVLTYAFSDGRDLDTRTRVVTPDIGQDSQLTYLGWDRNSYYPTTIVSGSTVMDKVVLYWGGDNQGIGTESVLINLVRFKELYPSETKILVDCRCEWFGDVGVNDVYISAKLYKGGNMIRQLDNLTGYNFDNSGYTASYDITSVGKTITLATTDPATSGERIATLSYDLTTNNGLFNNNDIITPSV